MPNERLSCGCRYDGRYLCWLHRPQHWLIWIAQEASALVSLALFIGMIAVWAQIFGGR